MKLWVILLIAATVSVALIIILLKCNKRRKQKTRQSVTLTTETAPTETIITETSPTEMTITETTTTVSRIPYNTQCNYTSPTPFNGTQSGTAPPQSSMNQEVDLQLIASVPDLRANYNVLDEKYSKPPPYNPAFM